MKMHITVDLPEELISELVRLSKARRVENAVRIALEEFVRHKKAERLLPLPGKIKISDVTSELEKMDIEESNAKV